MPGATVDEAVAAARRRPGPPAARHRELQAWMQELADQAIAELAGRPLRHPRAGPPHRVLIAPTNDGGIYYTGPSEDFTRPGRMWWSVPEGVTEFATWREITTVYHEGVPGHHLQVAQTVYRTELLNRWQRLSRWVSGPRRGLGAVRRAADGRARLPGRPGRPAGHARRPVAARGPGGLDIGMHCGFEAPAEVGRRRRGPTTRPGVPAAHANMDEGFLRFELDRYLGWPGQAPSYKVGERIWLQLRDEVGPARATPSTSRRSTAARSTSARRPRPAAEAVLGEAGPSRGSRRHLRGFPRGCRIAALALVATVTAVAGLARRFDLSAPLLLTLVGVVGSFLPFIPEVHLSSEVVLVGLLPPLLYAAAIRSSLVDFRANRRVIGLLSVGLVIFTALGVGLVTWWLLPVPFAAAFALGAVVAPPDAVAATAIARRIGLPRRIVTILEGESLVNDATALVSLRTATVALAGAPSRSRGGLDFAPGGGRRRPVGLVVAWLVALVRKRVTDT